MRQMQLVFFVSTDSRAVINILVINDIIGLRAVNYFNRKQKQPKKPMFQNLFLVAPGLFFALFFFLRIPLKWRCPRSAFIF